MTVKIAISRPARPGQGTQAAQKNVVNEQPARERGQQGGQCCEAAARAALTRVAATRIRPARTTDHASRSRQVTLLTGLPWRRGRASLRPAGR